MTSVGVLAARWSHSEGNNPNAAQNLELDQEALADLLQVEELLRKGVRSTESVPEELAERLVQSGGKRIRPYLTCLTYRSLLKQASKPKVRADLEDLWSLASVSEWVHTATLFHDDVLDASLTRRGSPSAHVTHGNKVAILVGDFVYAEAFALLMDRGLLEPSKQLASTVKSIVSGELIQHRVATDRSLSLVDYDKIARAKTGALFAWCTGTGAWMAGSTEISAAESFGRSLGYAFQMADDLIDTFEIDALTASGGELLQWVESAPPLPLVIAAEISPSEVRAQITQAWGECSRPHHALETQRQMVHKLQTFCRTELVLGECSKRVEQLLSEAEADLRKFGALEGLSWALATIGQRALEGIALGRLSEAATGAS